jgi:UDP-glucose 4-epimerase
MEVVMSHVIVTGGNGFVGRALCRALSSNGHSVTGVVRHAPTCVPGVDEWVIAGPDFDGIERAWPRALRAECVVHLAARVHVMHDPSLDPLAAFRKTNVEGTLRVAKAARENGIRRMVFVSSIKAVAESDPGRPLREDDPASPQDAYGRSKHEAEIALRKFADESGLDVVIVRPPLVYGPEVRANFLALMRSVAKGIPLPLAGIEARRSLLYVENLADALVKCATVAEATRQCFHVADDEDATVAELVRAMAKHLNTTARLLPMRASWLRLAGRMTGRLPQVERLIGNLRVDNSHIRDVLDWQPPYRLDDGLAETARWYRSMH